jgi:hypothetical protein
MTTIDMRPLDGAALQALGEFAGDVVTINYRADGTDRVVTDIVSIDIDGDVRVGCLLLTIDGEPNPELDVFEALHPYATSPR